ncbi:WD40 repeat-like protein [Paxillus ammoniavirescens]|nr:WD40 repeat-like protein [Paxillus ammoniavirescens]
MVDGDIECGIRHRRKRRERSCAGVYQTRGIRRVRLIGMGCTGNELTRTMVFTTTLSCRATHSNVPTAFNAHHHHPPPCTPSVDMLTSSRSGSPEITNIPPVVKSTSSQSVSSKKANHQVPMQIFEGHEGLVRCVRFCPDEDKLITGSSDKTLRIWNRTTGAVEVLRGHSGTVWDVDVSWDGKMIVSGSRNETVRIWNRESGEMMHVLEGHEDEVMSVQFSLDSSRVVSGSDDKTVRVSSVETGELAFEPIKCHGYVYCVRYSPSGDRIASGADSVQIWNAETGSGIISIRNSSVNSVAWTTEGTYVIGGCEGEVAIWNSHTGEQLRTWKAHDKWITLSLPPSGSHLATSNWNDKTAFVFDVSTGEQIAKLKHSVNVNKIAYSPSGKSIATGCPDAKVYLWEAPAVEDPPAKSPAPPFSSLLDRPAIPLAGSSRNSRRELDAFWDTLPNRNQQTPPHLEPQRVFDKVRNTYTNIFTRRPAGATQAVSPCSVRTPSQSPHAPPDSPESRARDCRTSASRSRKGQSVLGCRSNSHV